MTDESLNHFYSSQGFSDALSLTRASVISSAINRSVTFDDSSLRSLEIGAYAAFQNALGDEGLEGFLRKERYPQAADHGIESKSAWFSAYDALSTFLDSPGSDSVSSDTLLFFSSISLAADKPNAASQILHKFDLSSFEVDSKSWDQRIISKITISLLSLTRQASLEEIKYSQDQIAQLSNEQEKFERQWLENESRRKAISLFSLYHIAQATLGTAKFLKFGNSEHEAGVNNFEPELTQLLIKAEEFAYQSSDLELINFVRICGIINWKIFSNSLWRHVGGISEDLDEFITSLHSSDKSKKVFSLLPSQQQAVKQALFDPSKLGIVLEMPTSSGKTLLAEFLIVQAIAMYGTDSRILYVAPTRALASQVKRNLAVDLRERGIQVTGASNAFEEDPYELSLLRESNGVVVATPEKADLLLRAHPEWYENVSLVVVDEAHLLADGERGARLELLLTNLRRSFNNLRFLLLTPFIENAETISNWLGGERGVPINVSWRPSNIVAGVTYKKRPSRGKLDLWAKWKEPHNIFNRHPRDTCLVKDIKSTEISSVRDTVNVYAEEFARLGSVLAMFPSSPKESENSARKFSENRASIPKAERPSLLRAAIALAKLEYGEKSLLAQCLEKGVAFHHGSVSQELRYLVERLVSDGCVNYIFSTSTLAQGMNFPVSTVLMHSVHKPYGGGNLSSSEFWNIAGRAGRVGLSDKGIVLFANPDHEQHWERYCSELSKPLDSALIKAINEIQQGGDLKTLYRRNEAIRPFIQYILHACAEHGVGATRAQLAQLIEASLFNAQLTSVAESRKARTLANSYVDLLEGRSTGYLKLTDSTGLGSFSFDELRAKVGQDKLLSEGASAVYESGVEGMTSLVKALQWLPELNLSMEISSGTLNVDTIGEMAWKWIGGESIEALSHNYPEKDEEERVRKTGSYVYRKLSQMLAWGSHAYLKTLRMDTEEEGNVQEMMLPAYLQYGVNKPEAVIASIFGIPRAISNAIGTVYQAENGLLSPENAGEFRKLLESDSTDFWTKVNSESGLETSLSTNELISLVRDIQGS